MNKKEIRKDYLKIRDNIENREMKEEEIFQKLSKYLDKNKNIMSYMSIKSEVSTKKINTYIKNLVLPAVVGENLIPRKINNMSQDTCLGNFNIIEPKSSLEIAEKIDIVIVPAVCFSKNMQRIGYGKGFYDRFLQKKEIFKIGICFEEQIIENLQQEKFDIPMDIIISDKQIIKYER